MSKKTRYPKQVFWSEEDEGYIAIAPDLPGSSAFGETESEALHELDDAIEGWIAAAKGVGNPVPPPSNPNKQHSGKLLVRMPRRLHGELVSSADREGVSLNQYVVFLLSQGTSSASTVASPVRTHQTEELFYGSPTAVPLQAIMANYICSGTSSVGMANVSLRTPSTINSVGEVVVAGNSRHWHELLDLGLKTYLAGSNTFANTIWTSVDTVDRVKAFGG